MRLFFGIFLALITGCRINDLALLDSNGDVATGAGGHPAAEGGAGSLAGARAGSGGGGSSDASRAAGGSGGAGGLDAATTTEGAAGSTGGAAGSLGGSGASGSGGGGGVTWEGGAAGGLAGSDGGIVRHAFLESGGLFSIEAEHFARSVPGTGLAAGIAWQNVAAQPDTSGSSEQAMPTTGVNVGDSTDGPKLEYDLKFVDTGTFSVWIRLLGGAQSGSVHVGMDGAAPVTYGGRGIGANAPWNNTTWMWDGEVDGVPGPNRVRVTVDVSSADYHTLQVYMRQDGVAFDKMVVSKDSAAPTGTGPAESPRE